MLAIDRPFVANSLQNGVETCEGVCLEYGSATQLYLVPFVRQAEQVFFLVIVQYLSVETEAVIGCGSGMSGIDAESTTRIKAWSIVMSYSSS